MFFTNIICGLKPLKLICTSGFLVRLNVIARIAAHIWPVTVAIAAPATPIFGIPNKPKINIGSRMILIIAPVDCVIIVNIVRPVDWRILSKPICIKIPNDISRQILVYSIPIFAISPAPACARKNGFVTKIPISKNKTYPRTSINIPFSAVLFAASNFFSPSARESIAFIPTPVPTATEIIRFCIGNAIETAVNASSESLDTNILSTML